LSKTLPPDLLLRIAAIPADAAGLTEMVGQAVTDLATGPDPEQKAYLLAAAGLRPLVPMG